MMDMSSLVVTILGLPYLQYAPEHLCLLSKSDRSLIAGDMVAGGTHPDQSKEGSFKAHP